jgi:hypothetical protein
MIKQSTLFQWIFLSIMAVRAAAFVVKKPLARARLEKESFPNEMENQMRELWNDNNLSEKRKENNLI